MKSPHGCYDVLEVERIATASTVSLGFNGGLNMIRTWPSPLTVQIIIHPIFLKIDLTLWICFSH